MFVMGLYLIYFDEIQILQVLWLTFATESIFNHKLPLPGTHFIIIITKLQLFLLT